MLLEYKNRNELPDETAVVIFNHIQRTGGTSIEKLLISHYGKQCAVAQPFSSIDCCIKAQKDELRCAYGHNVSGIHTLLPEQRKVFYFTFIRHPLEREMSHHRIRHIRKSAFWDQDKEYTDKIAEYYIYNEKPNPVVDLLGNGDLGLAEDVLFSRYPFFGVTEFFAASMHGLSEILPWLKGCAIPHTNKAKKGGIAISKRAEEYFLEKNSKDMELYEKAVKEFKRRFPGQYDMVTSEESRDWSDSVSRHCTYIKKACRTRSMPQGKLPDCRLKTPSPQMLFGMLRDAPAWMKDFYPVFIEYCKDDMLRDNTMKVFSLFCNARLDDERGINTYGNEVLDILDGIDNRAQVAAIMRLRLKILSNLLAANITAGKGTIFERFSRWLSALGAAPEWRALSLNMEAAVLEKSGEFAAALDRAKAAVGLAPGNDEFHNDLCRLLLENGAAPEAESEARRALAENPNSEWALRQLALAVSAKGNRQEAMALFKRALEKNPCWKKGQSALLKLLLKERLFEEAEFRAHEFLAYAPWRAQLHIFLSRVFEARGEIDRALGEIRSIVSKAPRTKSFRNSFMTLLKRHDSFAAAEKDVYENFSTLPEQGWPYLQLSQACEKRGGESIAKGLEYARKAYALQPGKRSLAENLGRFLRLANSNDELESFCRQAIDRDPAQGWAWRELCRKADACGEHGQALELGKKAIAVHPQDEEFKRYYDEMRLRAYSAIKA